MALIYEVTLRPSKLELLGTWLPGQSWAGGGELPERAGSFRFDDPAGEVGVETLLVTVGDTLLQVPLTYRGAPLAGAEDHLVGMLDHPVLGERWVYDAVVDPVYLTGIADAVLTGTPQAAQVRDVAGTLVPVPPTLHLEALDAAGRAAPGLPGAVTLRTPLGPVVLFRRPERTTAPSGRRALLASGAGVNGTVQLAAAAD